MALTTDGVATLRAAPDGDCFYWDDGKGGAPGLGVKVTPNEHRSFIYQYRFDGRPRRYTIGKASTALTLTQARTRARALAAMVVGGDDPMAAKATARSAVSVLQLLDAYRSSESFKAKAPGTQAGDCTLIDYHIKPTIGSERAHHVTPDTVRGMRRAIVEGKTSGVFPGDKARGRRRIRGGEGAAGHAVTLLTTAYNWAMREKLFALKDNPAASVPGHVSNERMIAVGEGDYGRIFGAIDELETEGGIPTPHAEALRLIALSGLRRSEAALLRRHHVQIEHRRLFFARGQHKTGNRTRKPKIVPLSAAALAIIERNMRPGAGADDLVFAPAEGAHVRLNPAWNKVRVRAKLSEGFVLHGLRHAVGASLALDNASTLQIAQTLGHARASTAEIYVAFADAQRANIAERVASLIQRDGREAAPARRKRKAPATAAG